MPTTGARFEAGVLHGNARLDPLSSTQWRPDSEALSEAETALWDAVDMLKMVREANVEPHRDIGTLAQFVAQFPDSCRWLLRVDRLGVRFDVERCAAEVEAAEAAVYGELWRLWEAREQVLNTWLVRLYVPATQRTAPVYEVDAMYAEVKAVSGAQETVWAACRDFDDVMIRCRRRLMDISLDFACGALEGV